MLAAASAVVRGRRRASGRAIAYFEGPGFVCVGLGSGSGLGDCVDVPPEPEFPPDVSPVPVPVEPPDVSRAASTPDRCFSFGLDLCLGLGLGVVVGVGVTLG
jgi:hypothetical protein